MDWNTPKNEKSVKAQVALFTRAWIEIILYNIKYLKYNGRPLHEGVDWNANANFLARDLGSRPLHEGVDWNKWENFQIFYPTVALFTRAWIEIFLLNFMLSQDNVALFTRAWIEMLIAVSQPYKGERRPLHEGVDWNIGNIFGIKYCKSRPLHEDVDWNFRSCSLCAVPQVALFTRAWIEMLILSCIFVMYVSRPLHEGVDWNECCNKRC